MVKMAPAGLSERLVKEIAGIAERHGMLRVVVFGSRARGDHSSVSDIDLAVWGGDFAAFSLDVDEETYTLLRFDFVNMDGAVNDDLARSIETEGIAIYEKGRAFQGVA